MHRSQINEKMSKSTARKFQSTNKENWLSPKSIPPLSKTKTQVYLQRLQEMQKKYQKQVVNNQQKILELREKCKAYKSISEQQAKRVATCEISLAKEEYMNEVVMYKSEVYKIQDFLACISEEAEEKRRKDQEQLENEKRVYKQRCQRLAELEKDITKNKEILEEKQAQILADRTKIQQNKTLLFQRQQKEARYLQIITCINSKQSLTPR